eukprot:gene14351-16933_t
MAGGKHQNSGRTPKKDIHAKTKHGKCHPDCSQAVGHETEAQVAAKPFLCEPCGHRFAHKKGRDEHIREGTCKGDVVARAVELLEMDEEMDDLDDCDEDDIEDDSDPVDAPAVEDLSSFLTGIGQGKREEFYKMFPQLKNRYARRRMQQAKDSIQAAFEKTHRLFPLGPKDAPTGCAINLEDVVQDLLKRIKGLKSGKFSIKIAFDSAHVASNGHHILTGTIEIIHKGLPVFICKSPFNNLPFCVYHGKEDYETFLTTFKPIMDAINSLSKADIFVELSLKPQNVVMVNDYYSPAIPTDATPSQAKQPGFDSYGKIAAALWEGGATFTIPCYLHVIMGNLKQMTKHSVTYCSSTKTVELDEMKKIQDEERKEFNKLAAQKDHLGDKVDKLAIKALTKRQMAFGRLESQSTMAMSKMEKQLVARPMKRGKKGDEEKVIAERERQKKQLQNDIQVEKERKQDMERRLLEVLDAPIDQSGGMLTEIIMPLFKVNYTITQEITKQIDIMTKAADEHKKAKETVVEMKARKKSLQASTTKRGLEIRALKKTSEIADANTEASECAKRFIVFVKKNKISFFKPKAEKSNSVLTMLDGLSYTYTDCIAFINLRKEFVRTITNDESKIEELDNLWDLFAYMVSMVQTDQYHVTEENWLKLSKQFGRDYLEMFTGAQITSYMHTLIYHTGKYIKLYGCLFKFANFGIECRHKIIKKLIKASNHHFNYRLYKDVLIQCYNAHGNDTNEEMIDTSKRTWTAAEVQSPTSIYVNDVKYSTKGGNKTYFSKKK